MKKIAIAGTGYVGLVAGVCFANVGHSVVCVDPDDKKILELQKGISPIYEKDLEPLIKKNISEGRLKFSSDYSSAYQDVDAIFIGVGTPEQDDGSANLSFIASVARQVAESIIKDCLVVVKSTVPVGTSDKVEQFILDFLSEGMKNEDGSQKYHVEVASNPEFLAQGTAVYDTLHAARIVIGSESTWSEERLREIYEPFGLPIVSVSRRSAEMIKYASNDFLALKLSYMNDIANLCELVGADIQDVAKGMAFDERIGAKFLNAGVGYGGSCFPKDTKALEYLANQYGYQLRTVKAAIDVNNDQKISLFNKASKRLITFCGLKVAVLGLTFKPGTDDLREAPSLENIRLLTNHGADVWAYDPVGIPNCQKIFPEGKTGKGTIHYSLDFNQCLSKANVCFIFTEWDCIKSITPQTYKNRMRTPLVFDGRNIYSISEMKDAHVEYHSIGR